MPSAGLPLTSIVLAVTGFSPIPIGQVPLWTLLPPQGQFSCYLLVTTDVIEPILTTTGSATSSLFLPPALGFLGATLHHQMLPMGLDPQGNWVELSATNTLQLNIGTF